MGAWAQGRLSPAWARLPRHPRPNNLSTPLQLPRGRSCAIASFQGLCGVISRWKHECTMARRDGWGPGAPAEPRLHALPCPHKATHAHARGLHVFPDLGEAYNPRCKCSSAFILRTLMRAAMWHCTSSPVPTCMPALPAVVLLLTDKAAGTTPPAKLPKVAVLLRESLRIPTSLPGCAAPPAAAHGQVLAVRSFGHHARMGTTCCYSLARGQSIKSALHAGAAIAFMGPQASRQPSSVPWPKGPHERRPPKSEQVPCL